MFETSSTVRYFSPCLKRWALLSACVLALMVGFGPGWAADPAFDMGVRLYNQRSYRAALAHFENSLRANPQSATVLYYIGLCNQQLGDFVRAKQAYRSVCQQFAGSPEAEMSASVLRRVDPSFAATQSNAGASGASARGEPAHPTTSLSAAELKSLPNSAKVPFTRGAGRHLYIDAQVNGRPIKVMFDTGAEVCLFGSNHLAQAGVSTQTEGPPVPISGVGGVVYAKSMVVDIAVGPIRRKIPVLVQPDLATAPLLGQTFFQGFEYRIDNQAGLIAFSKKGAGVVDRDTPLDSVAVPFTKAGNSMVVDVEVNGQPYPFYFDTGASGNVMSMIDAKRLGIAIGADADMVVSRGVGGTMPGFNIKLDRMRLGPILKTNVPVTVLMLGPDRPLLGQTFFGDRQFTIDNDKGVIRFFH